MLVNDRGQPAPKGTQGHAKGDELVRRDLQETHDAIAQDYEKSQRSVKEARVGKVLPPGE